MSPYEKVEAQEAIRSHIMGAWRTDEIRRTKPSPQVESHCDSDHQTNNGIICLRAYDECTSGCCSEKGRTMPVLDDLHALLQAISCCAA